MNRSHARQCIFFHVPRTGGSSIESLDWWDQWTGHFPKADEVDFGKLNHDGGRGKWFSFAMVRNPWDRFVSLYHYLAAMTPEHRWYRANAQLVAQVRRMRCFAEFCRGFHRWPHRNNFHFWPQAAWITDAQGRLLVDFVGRFERFQHDFDKVCSRLGLPAPELPRLNSSPHEPYRACYDDETRRIVAELSRRDIAAFGYTFDQ